MKETYEKYIEGYNYSCYKAFENNADLQSKWCIEFSDEGKKIYEDGQIKRKKKAYIIIAISSLAIGLGIYLIINGYYQTN